MSSYFMRSVCMTCGVEYGRKPCIPENDGRESHGYCPVHAAEEMAKLKARPVAHEITSDSFAPLPYAKARASLLQKGIVIAGIICLVAAAPRSAMADVPWLHAPQPSSSLTFEEADEAACSAAAALSRATGRTFFVLRAQGSSMRPAVADQAVYVLEICDLAALEVGDHIVLKRGAMVVGHRVFSIEAGSVVAVGDNDPGRKSDRVTKDTFIGRVVAVFTVNKKAPANRG